MCTRRVYAPSSPLSPAIGCDGGSWRRRVPAGTVRGLGPSAAYTSGLPDWLRPWVCLLASAGLLVCLAAPAHAVSPFKKSTPATAPASGSPAGTSAGTSGASTAAGGATPASFDAPASDGTAAAPAAGAANGKTATGKNAKGGRPTPMQSQKGDLIAVINGEKITREELAKECVKHYGKDVLDGIVHKQMIADYCAAQGVTVTDEEIEKEIDRMATKFKIPKAQWIKLLEKERGISRAQYTQDIIWPSLALRKLATPELTVSQEEIDKAYVSQFGPAAKVRLIIVSDGEKAKKLRAAAVAKPDDFAALARQNSEDSATASSGGLIPPIRHHVGDPQLEKYAFELPDGAISPVVHVQSQYVIMKVEARLPGTEMDRKGVDPVLIDALKEGKIHAATLEVFNRIEKQAQVDLVFGDPEKQKKMPGVAAVVGGQQITVRQLAEACIDRHGIETLDRLLDRKLLVQELHRRKLAVDQKDIDSELARAAISMGQVKADGKPDIASWLEQVTKQQHLEIDVYMMDAVWPSVALKKLVGEKVAITEEDLKKGYEANYGPRCRCRAIIVPNQRKRQEVWEKARDNTSLENFANLARKFSTETNSAQLGGQMPPIQRHGGQPLLEQEAFSLKPGELSSVLQVGENFVILFCEGYTEPVKIDVAEARHYIEEDLQEKKLRIAMHKEFEKLQDGCTIDNYLAGTMKSPQSRKNVLKAKDPLDVDPAALGTTDLDSSPSASAGRRSLK